MPLDRPVRFASNEAAPAQGGAGPASEGPAALGVTPDDLTRAVASPTRLRAVQRTGLLDTAAEDNFDRLTALASRLLNVPTVLVTLVDSHRDFLKSRHGLPAGHEGMTELTGRTFCQYSVALRAPLIISDTAAREDVSEIASVRQYGVRAYAGFPLIDDQGEAIGAFSAVDFKPREWSVFDLDVLFELAHAVMREIRLRVALTETHASLAARDQTMAVVAHDLRTPLSVVTMYSQLLQREQLSSRGVHMVERMQRTAEGMAQLIRNMLDISQIESGTFSLHPDLVDPGVIAHDVLAQHAAVAEQQAITLLSNCEPQLPAVRADAERVALALGHLLRNAMAATAPGGSVTVSVKAVDQGVRLAVRDTGRGLSAEKLDELMRHSGRVKLHDRRGAGFGLAIASGIVALHAGTFDATSREGEGSEFGFTLPL